MTTVVVSHDLASLRTIADHVLVLGEGRALFCGKPAELEASPDPYLRQFLQREAGEVQDGGWTPQAPAVTAALEQWLQR